MLPPAAVNRIYNKAFRKIRGICKCESGSLPEAICHYLSGGQQKGDYENNMDVRVLLVVACLTEYPSFMTSPRITLRQSEAQRKMLYYHRFLPRGMRFSSRIRFLHKVFLGRTLRSSRFRFCTSLHHTVVCYLGKLFFLNGSDGTGKGDVEYALLKTITARY